MKNNKLVFKMIFLIMLFLGTQVPAQEIQFFEEISITEIQAIPARQGRLSTRFDNALKRLEFGTTNVEKSYNNFKKYLLKDFGLQYSLDVTFLSQNGVAGGGKTGTQSIYAPSVSWQMFNDKKYGSGTLNVSYTAVRYWTNKGQNITNRLGLANPINDFPNETNSFDELSYTQTMFDNMLSVTIGQFPIYDFDGTEYNSNQQVNFMNYALSQNGTSTYPVAGLGGYVSVNPTKEMTFSVGVQNARNISGETLSTNGMGDKRYTTFGSFVYNPKINGQSGQYSFMVYNQPSVDVQPQNTVGWSVSMSQNLNDKWGVFMRANAVTGSVTPTKQSYVLGGVLNNPLKRNPLDQIGFAVAFNKVNKASFDTTSKLRNYETVLETYWNVGITQFFTIAPDIQVYVHPAAKPSRTFGTVFGLRGTFLF